MIIIFQILFFLCIFVVLYSYGIYPFLLIFLARFWGRKTQFDSQYLPRIGVVIPVYNEEDVIERKIKNIFSLDYPEDKLSIWIGSDCSSDQTNELVNNYPDSRVHLWTAPERGGKTEILNQLIPHVEADILLLTDANTEHRQDCLKKMIGYFADPETGIVAGRVIHTIKRGQEFAEEFYRQFEVWQKYNESLLHSSISAFGGFYLLRKNLFQPIPFNAYSNDDVLIPMNVIRKGKRVLFDNDAVSLEDVSGDIKIEFTRRIRIGAGNFQSFFWLLDFLNPLKGWPWFCYVSHKVIRWFSPLLMLAGYACLIALFVLTHSPVYLVLLTIGLVGCGMGLMYRIFPLRVLRPLYYFMAMNLALFFGLFRFLIGIKSAAWSRTER